MTLKEAAAVIDVDEHGFPKIYGTRYCPMGKITRLGSNKPEGRWCSRLRHHHGSHRFDRQWQEFDR